MATLPSQLYVTLNYVDPTRVKCANPNCSHNGETRNRIDTKLLATGDSDVHLWIRGYFCDECYSRYKAAVVPGIGSHYDPDCEFCNPPEENK
jgi:hypothetical protein